MTTFTHIDPQSRQKDQWGHFWTTQFSQEDCVPCFLSESDVGVMRNLGRNGSRYGAKAICSVLKTRQTSGFPLIPKIYPLTISNQQNELNDYLSAQQKSQELIEQHFSQRMIHLGGGHDHVYPLLKSFEKKVSSLLIINIDAHCDTRNDVLPHSGNPFSRFAQSTQLPFHLYQWGIHSSSNSKQTIEQLATQSTIYPRAALNIQKLQSDLSQHPSNNLGVIISIDADALESAIMEGVSAVNPWGLSLQNVLEIIQLAKKQFSLPSMALGIYEYNPAYDNLSQKGARALAMIVEEFCK